MAMTTISASSEVAPALGVAPLSESVGLEWPQPARDQLGTLPLSRLRRVTDYIQEHLDQNLTLAQLGAVVCMSPFHFARLFQRTTGMPPHRFVVRARIDRALTLLTVHESSIGGIARTVGFRTPSHFSTVFRRITGITPRAYRIAYGRAGLARGEQRHESALNGRDVRGESPASAVAILSKSAG
jgi:AraC-like DNA-binding protein